MVSAEGGRRHARSHSIRGVSHGDRRDRPDLRLHRAGPRQGPNNRRGQIYLVATLITAVTALGIFRHGGFGPPHALAVLTLVALAVGTVAARSHVFGWASRYVQAASYSATILFHMIPAVTESSTRLPP